MAIFDFNFLKRKKKKKPSEYIDYTPNDSAITISNSAQDFFAFSDSFYSSDQASERFNENRLIETYRKMALESEIEMAIDEIVNEAITSDDGDFVDLDLDQLDSISDGIKKKLNDEFQEIKKIMDLFHNGHDLFRRFYIDGRLYHHIILHENVKNGIKEIRYIDPRKIRKVIEMEEVTDEKTGVKLKKVKDEYFVFNETGFIDSNVTADTAKQYVKLPLDSISFVSSGLFNENNTLALSYLHKAIRPFNNLRTLEDAVVIYRLSRAPERRVFYIDVGNLPTSKAEQYLKRIMQSHRTKLSYDPETGKVVSEKKHMTMLEDFWFARREGSRGTEIDTLQSGQNLGEMEDVEYFRQKLYKSLNVPISRLESEAGFNIGRASEITRDEVKFQKFIYKLRIRFAKMFTHFLKIQASAKGIMSIDEFEEIENEIKYVFAKDNHFSKLKDLDVLQEKLNVLNNIDSYVGRYFSENWVRKNVLDQSDEEIEKMKEEMEEDGENEDEDGEEDFPPKKKSPMKVTQPEDEDEEEDQPEEVEKEKEDNERDKKRLDPRSTRKEAG